MTLLKAKLLASLVACSLAAASAGVVAAELRIGEVLDMEVVDRLGEEVGEVQDVILDLETGEVRSLVIEPDTFFGFANELFARPLSDFALGGDNDTLVLLADRQAIGAAGFPRDRWPSFEAPYWAMTSPQPGGYPFPAGGVRFPGGPQADASAGGTTLGASRLIRASALVEREVTGAFGDEVGEVENIVFDLATGEAVAVIDIDDSWREARVPLAELSLVDGELRRRQ